MKDIIVKEQPTFDVSTLGANASEIIIVDETAGDSLWDPTYSVSPDELPVSMEYGHEIYAHARFIGTSDFYAKLTGWFTDPDGNKRGEYAWEHSVLDGAKVDVITDTVKIDKAGTWKLNVRIEEA